MRRSPDRPAILTAGSGSPRSSPWHGIFRSSAYEQGQTRLGRRRSDHSCAWPWPPVTWQPGRPSPRGRTGQQVLTLWSQAWTANCAALRLVQHTGATRFSHQPPTPHLTPAAARQVTQDPAPILVTGQDVTARHKPTLTAAARSQMTASPPRGTFSQAELAGDRVITRCITRPESVLGATIEPCQVTSTCCLCLSLPPRPARPRRHWRASCVRAGLRRTSRGYRSAVRLP